MNAVLGSGRHRIGAKAAPGRRTPRRGFNLVMTIQETLAQLVAINSVSARSNAEICDYLSRRCEAIGLHVKRHPYIDDKGVEKINLVATSSPAIESVQLALVGHTDTVPFDPNW